MRVTVITGPMFSGKSDELIRRLERLDASGEIVRVFVHKEGVHYETIATSHGFEDYILSRTGRRFRGKRVESLKFPDEDTAMFPTPTVLAVDEAQFFREEEVRDLLENVRSKKNRWFANVKHVLFAGLDTDFRNEPFGPMGYLLAIADEVVKLTWVCGECGSLEGTKTQRLNFDGTPALRSEDIIVPGDNRYETRCAACHKVG